MACPESENLTAYLDRELGELARERMERHLSGCVACRETLGMLRAMVGELEAVPALEPSPALRRRVLAGLSRPMGFWERLGTRWVGPLGALAAAAALAVMVIGRASVAPPSPVLPGNELHLAENLDVVASLPVIETSDLSDEDLEAVAVLDQLSAESE